MRKSFISDEFVNFPITRKDRLIALGLGIGVLLLFIATRLQVHNQCVDCSNNAAFIQRGELKDLFQGAHLIYLWLMSGIYQLTRSLFQWGDAYAIAQAFNSVIASLTASVFFLFTRTIIRERWLSLVLTLVLAFTYHYWLFASDVEVHTPAVFFYLLSLLITVRLPLTTPIWQFGILGVLSAIAILFHAFCGVMIPIVIILILLQREDKNNKMMLFSTRKIKIGLIYGLIVTLCVVLSYLLVTTQVLHLQTASEIISWVFSFKEHVGIETRAALPLLTTLIDIILGIIRAFLGSIVWIATPELQQVFLRTFPNKCVGEELYLVRNLAPALAYVLTILSAIAGGLMVILALISIPGWIKALRRFSRVGIGLSSWLLLYAVLLMYLSPGGYGHWAMYWLPVFFLLVGLGISEAMESGDKRYGLAKVPAIALVISLFLSNLGNIMLQTNAENDLYLHRLSWYHTNTNTDDLIISAGSHKWTGYMNYHLQAHVQTLDNLFRSMEYPSAWENIQIQIQQTCSSGGRVFVMQDVLEPELCQANYRQWDLALYESFRHDIFPRLECQEIDEILICEVVC